LLKPTQLSSEKKLPSILDKFVVEGLADKYVTTATIYRNVANIINDSPVTPAQKALALRHLLISKDAALNGIK